MAPPPKPPNKPQNKFHRARRVIKKVGRHNPAPPGPTPAVAAAAYEHDPQRTVKLLLGVEAFARHMTDEGFQLQEGLRQAGYIAYGTRYPNGDTDVATILQKNKDNPPGVVFVQDKREWDPAKEGCFDKAAAFHNVGKLTEDRRIFRVTVCKDAQQNPSYHAAFANDIGCHAWVIYYHPDSVCKLATYVRREHAIRTYHSVDPAVVPEYAASDRKGCVLSGSLARYVYPLRHRIARNLKFLPIELHEHPGYHADGPDTADYLFMLSKYKVAICTASIYGYALRKIIEATAAGCAVITDLPTYDVLPEIDGNLIRITPRVTLQEISRHVQRAVENYNPAVQEDFSRRAVEFYNYARRGRELAEAIDHLRCNYPPPTN